MVFWKSYNWFFHFFLLKLDNLNNECKGIKIYIHISHEQIVDTYIFHDCPSYSRFLNYVPLKKKYENIACKISQTGIWAIAIIYSSK